MNTNHTISMAIECQARCRKGFCDDCAGCKRRGCEHACRCFAHVSKRTRRMGIDLRNLALPGRRSCKMRRLSDSGRWHGIDFVEPDFDMEVDMEAANQLEGKQPGADACSRGNLTIASFAEAFGWDKSWKKNVESQAKRENPVRRYEDIDRRTITLAMKAVTRAATYVAKKLFPFHFRPLLRAVALRILSSCSDDVGRRTLKTLLQGIKAAKKRSVEVRVLRAVLKAALTRRELLIMRSGEKVSEILVDGQVPLDSTTGDDDFEDSDEEYVPRTDSDGEILDDSLSRTTDSEESCGSEPILTTEPLFSDETGMASGTAEIEDTEAGNGDLPSNDLELASDSEPDDNDEADPGDLAIAFARSTQSLAISDWACILEAKSLPQKRRSLARFNREKVKTALTFILSPENSVQISWGRKIVKVGCGEELDLPRITRKRLPEVMWRAYLDYTDVMPPSCILPRSSFLRLVCAVTHGNDRILSAVDYVTGFLINDNFTCIEKIVRRFSRSNDEQKQLLAELSLSRNFIKNQFSSKHAQCTDNCASHGILYALSHEPAGVGDQNRTMSCNGCKYPFYFVDKLKTVILASSLETKTCAVEVLDNCAQKLKLYQGHRMRVLNQQIAIEQVKAEMKEECLAKKCGTRGILVVDFKMKYESKYFRGKTTEFFGKRGVGWHGGILRWYSYSEVDGVGTATLRSAYCDQILQGSNKQDGKAVLGLLEACLKQVKTELSNITSIALQSDNAKCYHAKVLLLYLPILSKITGIFIERYIHTETQDGKGLIDAHFARGSQHVDSYITEGNDAATPRQVYEALISNGGINNTFVQLITLDRKVLGALEATVEKIGKKFTKLVPRANEFIFHGNNNVVGLANMSSADVDWKATVFSYSRIGNGATMVFNFAKEDFKLTCNESQDDIPVGSEWVPSSTVANTGEAVPAAINANPTKLTGAKIVAYSCIASRLAPIPSRTNRRRNDEANQPEDRTLATCGCKMLLECLQDPASPIAIRNGRLDAPEYDEAQGFDMECYVKGWAQRPGHGSMYGESYIARYRPAIRKLFQLGVENTSEKMHASWMLERLQELYPNALDLPTEQDIRIECGRLFQLQKQGKPLTLLEERSKSKAWMEKLSAFADENLSCEPKPAKLLKSFKAEVLKQHPSGMPSDFPKDSQLLTKISQIKTAMKKEHNRFRF